mmetsp:Transcript_29500/g.44997  ORF Transcript_29500/g.44997 Transcript_29500/m.44997 type:complete len:83 (-) Transcript_29500:350-598(-)
MEDHPDNPPPNPSELEILAKLQLTFSSTLNMLEAARDNLVVLGKRMDNLCDSSKRCRNDLLQKRRDDQREAENEDDDMTNEE